MSQLETSLRAAASAIHLDGITKSYDSQTEVIPPMSAALKAAEFTVVLGPSGCGKSTLLQMIAGLEQVSGGKIRIGEREVQDLEPKDRGCAMVFQNYALYPHMKVRDNIGYSLKVAGLAKAERLKRVEAVSRMLSLNEFLDRRPSQLSGGQRQRVAIGRAIVREPAVLLFDEPLSNLDAKLRHEMRVELAELHKRIGATTVFVTHDQVEAMTLADRILILNKGRIEQFDTPKRVYRHPASVFVAQFIGSPPMNILPASGDGSQAVLSEGQKVAATGHKGEVLFGLRPEDARIGRTEGADIVLKARIEHAEDLGSHEVLSVRLSSGELLRVATQLGDGCLGRDGDIEISFSHSRVHLFDPQTGKAIKRQEKDS